MTRRGASSSPDLSEFRDALDSIAARPVVLFGGKGGVGKTTLASLAALHFRRSRRVILFTTDPASNLGDLFASPVPGLTVEQLDADALYRRFLGQNIDAFLELGDRGTYLDREELRRFFELALPGVDELMAWGRIGELADENRDAMLVVDTAPTGHTLRMLGARDHFRQLARALDAMQEKHRAIVRQLARRSVRDAMDAFIEEFSAQWERRRESILRGVFVPVFLSEPWVVDQTRRLIGEVPIEVPFAVMNRAGSACACERCRSQAVTLEVPVVRVPRACAPLDSVERLKAFWSAAAMPPLWNAAATPPLRPRGAMGAAIQSGGMVAALQIRRLMFFAGKGGVGKTTAASSVALQLAKDRKVTLLSVDPAHSVADVFARQPHPENLTIERVDTKAMWDDLRESVGQEISRAVDALTPGGLSLAYDREAVEKLIEIAPPGADELFAISRLADLISDEDVDAIVVDTAPTGHFLRLIDLPETAGEWVREFMRILLHYREVIPPGSLGERLVSASRALTLVEKTLRSKDAAVVVVTRPERIVIAETQRLIAGLERRGIAPGGVIANYVTPESDCACDRSMRAHEEDALRSLGTGPIVTIERRDEPPVRLSDLAGLVPVAHSRRG